MKAKALSPEQAKIGLEATLNATHSGTIVNGRVYRGPAMKDSIKHWTQPYEKPVLTHHNREGEPIGRVKSAKFHSLVSDKELERDHLTCKADDAGSGFVQLKAIIPDTDAVQKIIDGRYRTVSYGFETDSAVCTICGADWMKDGFFSCTHRPGKMYQIDEKSLFWEGRKTKKEFPAYLVTGKINPREVSFVNVPAQSLAGLQEYKMLKSEDAQIDELEFTSFMKMFYADVDTRQDAVSSLILTDGFVSQEVLIDSIVNQKPRGLSLFDVPAIGGEEPCATCGNDSEPKEAPMPDPAPETPIYSDEELARLNMLRNLYDKGIVELTTEEAEELADFTDAKLTGAQRKRLAGSTFCGPDRSWPVPDCSHVRTARSFLGDPAKTKNLSESQKASVRACVNRKAKALGCPGGDENKEKSRDSSGGTMPDDLQAVVKDLTDKLAAATAELATVKQQLTDANAKLKTTDDNRAKVYGELTDAFVNQFVLMRRVLDPAAIPADEAKAKELVDKLKLRSVDSLRDAIQDMTAAYATKVVELQKSHLTDHAGEVTDPTLETTNDPLKKGAVQAPKAKDLL